MHLSIPFLVLCIFVKPGLFQYEEEYLQSTDTLVKFWGIQDVTTSVGKLFHYKIPDDAFKGKILYYDVTSEKNSTLLPLPSWMIFDKRNAILEGVPTINDIGDVTVNVKAYDNQGKSVSDVFVIEVVPLLEKNTDSKRKCKKGEGVTMISVAIDKELEHFSSIEKISILKHIARHLYIPVDTLLLMSMKWSPEIAWDSESALSNLSSQTMNSTIVTWQIGCNERIWAKNIETVESVDKLVKNGNLSKILKLPISHWNIVSNFNPFRKRRDNQKESGASGPMADIDENGEDEEDGEDDPDDESDDEVQFLSSPVEHDLNSRKYDDSDFAKNKSSLDADIEPRKIPANTDRRLASSQPSDIVDEDTTEANEEFNEDESNSSLIPTPELSSATFNLTSSPITSTIEPTSATKPIIVKPKRYPPRVVKNLEQKRVEAGKPYRETIPEDIFLDNEDGNTRNLTLRLIKSNNCSFLTSWIELNSEKQELFILASLETISQHEFTIEAIDSDGMSCNTSLIIIVQYPQNVRTVNFEISLHMKYKENGNLSVALQFELLDAIASLYGDANSSKITVRNVTCDPFVFTWTNTTLSTQVCDNKTIADLLNVLTETEWGMNVNTRVKHALESLVIVEKVTWRGIQLCSEIPKAQLPQLEKQNFIPVVRNGIDNITATVGELTVFEIPKDTFYDADELNGRNLKLTLLNSDHSPLLPDNWLQFDSTNQEIYGLPMANDVGTNKYQLVCHDNKDNSEGMKAIHGLEVIVEPATKEYYNVEFRMKLTVSYAEFIKKPLMQRKFVEKLAELFKDKNTSSIVVSGFSPGSLIVTWHNKSLPVKECEENEILKLRKVLLTDEGKLDDNVNKVLKPEFEAISADITPIGICEGGLTEFHSLPPEVNTGSQEIHAIIFSNAYFTNSILPIVIIVIMIFVAGLIACVLYRRQRRAKWTLGDNDERRSFRNKGIPVIFQDELEERLEPTNKSPIIMKEEKPPLPPPEYQRVAPVVTTSLLSDFDGSPYQQGSGTFNSRSTERNGRSKQTPIYRKPPPYISQ